MSCLKPRSEDTWIARILSLSLVIEVGLITLQTWRGVASHFNKSTPLDASIGEAAQWLVWLASLMIAYLAFRSLVSLSVDRSYALAIRAGMLSLVAGCLLGIWTSFRGEQQLAAGLAAELIPPHGVLKFPHGMAMHVVQVLPIFAWLADTFGQSSRRISTIVVLAAIASTLMIAYSLVQTLAGRGRFDGSFPGLVLLIASLALFAVSLLYAVWPVNSAVAPTTGEQA